MLQTPSKTLAAFEALLAALDAEIRDFHSLGQLRFHTDGSPQSARLLTHAAIQRGQLRNEVVQLQAKWQADIQAPPPISVPPAPESARGPALHAQPKSVPHAMTHNEAAKRLGVRPEKIRGWLESGLLKGRQISRTKWQVDAQDLLSFARDHRDLLRSG